MNISQLLLLALLFLILACARQFPKWFSAFVESRKKKTQQKNFAEKGNENGNEKSDENADKNFVEKVNSTAVSFSKPELTTKVKMETELSISERILKNPFVEAAPFVAAFFPTNCEPDISTALKKLAREGKLLLPRCGKDYTMEFFVVSNLENDLEKGMYGIWEPKENCIPFCSSIPVFLVPGKKFSLDGARHGHGLGYYDRYLAKFPDAWKIGICFASQIESAPLVLKEHDIKMNEILSV